MEQLIQQAIAAHVAGRLTEAEALLRQIVAQDPTRADAWFNLGMIAGQAGRFDEAVAAFTQATNNKPDFSEAWLMLSECAGRLGQAAEALNASAQALKLLPQDPRALMRHGLELAVHMRDEEAAHIFEQLATREPAHMGAAANLAICLKNIGKPDEAENILRQALTQMNGNLGIGDDDEDHYNILTYHLALLELARGNWRDGFAHFRARFKGGTNWRRLNTPKPLWRGEALQEKTIFVSAEQGHGDMLMMARYLPLLKQCGARVILQAHPALVRFFEGWSSIDQVLSTAIPVNEIAFDFHVPIFDLPYRCGTDTGNIPQLCPYLPRPDIDEKNRLPADGKRKIGLVYAGHSGNPRDILRRLPLESLADILQNPTCSFYNLTRERTDVDMTWLQQHGVTDLTPQLNDFRDTAQMIRQLDVLITCDTAAAHLAAGMGQQVWIMLPFVPDWRWGYEPLYSPWYPTARLFRQKKRGEWGHIVNEIKNQLG